MHDPRTPEIMAWLETLELSERLATMHAMTFAFPLLKNDRAWAARVKTVAGKLKPTAAQRAEIMVRAGKISGRLKRELTPAR